MCVSDALTNSDGDISEARYGLGREAAHHVRTSPAGRVSLNVQLTEEGGESEASETQQMYSEILFFWMDVLQLKHVLSVVMDDNKIYK